MRIDKLIDLISWILLIITLLLLKLTSRYAENIVYGKRFVWNYFLWGLTIACLWTYLLYRMKRDYFEGGEKRASAILSQFFSIIILTIFINAYYTFHTGRQNINYKTAVISRTGSSIKTGTNYVHLVIDGREERFSPENQEYKKLAKGDTLLLTIGRGKTGYDFIYEFKRRIDPD